MRSPTRPTAESPAATPATAVAGIRDAESLFRTKPISEIRAIEAATRREIEQKKEELRQLVGKSYRDLIDSADSIIQMRSSCDSISANLSGIDAALRSLSSASSAIASPCRPPDPVRAKIYGIASRVKYLVDTPENIWGCLDESMLLEASGRYVRAREVHDLIFSSSADPDVLSRFPLLQHQWQIVDSFKAQISQRSRERLLERGLTVDAYADALSAAATIDDLKPKQALDIFLDSRRSWILQKLVITAADDGPVSSASVLCDIVRTVRASLGQVGQLFRPALNEMPLFYKMVLGSPPGTQLFGGIPNPEEEVKLWKTHREKLESEMILLEPELVSQACSSWLLSCCDEMFVELSNRERLIHSIPNGDGLAAAENMVHEALDGKEGLEGSLEEWLKVVFGSDIKSPWKQLCGLILKNGMDILEDRMEEALLLRMKEIVRSGFEELRGEVNIKGSVAAIKVGPDCSNGFSEYLKRSSRGGGVWFSELNPKRVGLAHNFKAVADENDFRSCLSAYFGPEVGRIRDLVDTRCQFILNDLLSFVESHNATQRLKELAPYIQDKCHKFMSDLLGDLEQELHRLSVSLGNRHKKDYQPHVIIERSLFLGRLLYALRNHSSHVPLILGSPRQWVKEISGPAYSCSTSPLSKQSKEFFNLQVSFSPRRSSFDFPASPGRYSLDITRKQAFSAAAALFPVDNSTNLKLDELSRRLQDLCIKAHGLWINWFSNELSIILSKNLNQDDALSSTNALRGWEVTVIKQEEATEGPSEIQITLPSMPSQYIISFLFQACKEVHKVGGHVLYKDILQNFAHVLLQKAIVEVPVEQLSAKTVRFTVLPNEVILGEPSLDAVSFGVGTDGSEVGELTSSTGRLSLRERGVMVVGIYENFLSAVQPLGSHVSEKGVLQVLLDLRFCADVLSGGKDSNSIRVELPHLRKRADFQSNFAIVDTVMTLIQRFSEKLDPIDWAT
ncbi:hypothetical protein AXF42_Ash005902 [Apostasia shenzhenica]|uniref:Conserved oligomeric Golgi complex subunit 1 n=1 Tax=Apostasia shenzhenica TaxID=1088818 RepID=A0A2I0BCP1_9ASPA|nr:hypothetical protein AXF42_Ash005902 [Apostasia shenzhenica]